MKSGFWKTDWFLGVAVAVVIALFARTSDLIPSLERKAYDLGVTATSRTPSDKIAVIAIDNTSLDNIGRWPWSRKVLADVTDKLAAAKAAGLFITHVEGAARPTVNGQPIGTAPHALKDHDLIELAGIKMEFFLKG